MGAVALSACGSPSTPKAVVVKPAKVGIYQAVAAFSGPVTVGHVILPLTGLPLDLTQHGYVQQEVFASGTAHAFRDIVTFGRQLDDRADDIRHVPHEDSRPAAVGWEELQRHCGRRVDERVGR